MVQLKSRKKSNSVLDRVNINDILKNPDETARKLSISDLAELIVLLREYYYNTDTPLVPDAVYDEVEDILRERDPKNKVLSSIGADVKEAVHLPYPMPSLNKAKAGSGIIEKWLSKYPGPYTVSHKLDGISLMFYYNHNQSSLFTRGNGMMGQNITGMLKYLDLGRQIKIPKQVTDFAVRGEAIMPKKTWDKYYADQFPNVRNWISGVLNSKHPNPTDVKRIQFVSYQVLHPRMKHSEQLKLLNDWGFHVTDYKIEQDLDEAELIEQLDYSRDYGTYQIDGLVIVQDEVFDLTTDNPKHSIAFKNMSDEVAQTIVTDVIWKASKRSILKPTVYIKPVFLSGGKLSKATGHNAKYIKDNKIGPGAVVTIVRSGEVIPYIVEVNKPASKPAMPTDIDYEWTEGGYDIVITEATDEVSLAVLEHMSTTLGIDHLGKGTLKKLVEMGYHRPEEVLNMTLEDWNDVPSLGKNAEKIYASIQKLESRGVDMSQLMNSTSIFPAGIGQKKMQLVLDFYPDLLDIYQQTKNPQNLVTKLIKIKGIESKTAESIVGGLGEFIKFLDLVPQIKIKDESESEEENEILYDSKIEKKIKGIRVVFTGVRDKELESIIQANGGSVANSVVKSMDSKKQILVAKDANAQSNKLNTARSLGIKIYDLEGFRKYILIPGK